MIIKLDELRRREEPLLIKGEFPESELSVDSQIAVLESPVRSSVKVSLRGDTVLVRGTVFAKLTLTCCCCAKKFLQMVEKQFEAEYDPDPVMSREGEEVELAYTDLDIGFYHGDQIDLSAVLAEQVVLEIPMKPKCQPECKGLCTQCGADLNEAACDCRTEVIDPRLAPLENLKKRFIH